MFIRELYYFLKVFNQSNYSDIKKEELQLFFSKNIINYAYENNVFYRNLYKKHCFHPNDFKTLEDLKKIPIVRKKDIVENFKDVVGNINEKKYKVLYTSGTTGNPFSVYLNEETSDYTNCIFTRSLIKQGYNPFKKLGFYWYRKESNSIFNKIGFVKKKIISYSDNPKIQYDIIKKNKLNYLFYFPFKLLEFSLYFSSDSLKKLKIKKIFCIGEILTKKMKLIFESKFGCPVYDNYALTETNIIGFKKENNLSYFINWDNNILELKNSKKGENIKKVIVTNLSNYFMPLIRYELDDFIKVNKKGKILEILGKNDNFIVCKKNYVHINSLIDIILNYHPLIYGFKFKISKKKIIVKIKELKNIDSIIPYLKNSICNATFGCYCIKIEKTKKLNYNSRGKFQLIEK